MKTQKLKPIACVLAVSIFLAGCNGGRSTADGSSNSLQAAQAIVNNNANHAAFIEMVKKAQQGPANYEVVNKNFYTPKEVSLAFDPNANKSVQSKTAQKSLQEIDYKTHGVAAVGGVVGMVPVIGPFLAYGVEQYGGQVYDVFAGIEATEYDANSVGNQMAKLQSRMTSLEKSMEKSNNEFYASLREQSANDTSKAQHTLFSAMQEISFGPNLGEVSEDNLCSLSSDDFVFHYYGDGGLGMEDFGTSCNPESKLNFMAIAKNLSNYTKNIDFSASDKQNFAGALVDVSGAITPAGYVGDFSTVTPVSNANQSALLQVMDAMFAQLKADAPQQGTASSNYVERIERYNQSVSFVLQVAYNSLQGAYAMEQTNNYLNFLAAVNALETKSKGTIPQIKGYEGIAAVNFSVKDVTNLSLDALEQDYINKQNNLMLLYTARTNIMFNNIMKYIVSDKPLKSLNLPALPTSYKIGDVSYSYEVPLRDYSKMYPSHYTTLDIPTLPQGNWKESTILYTWNGYSNYYTCSDISSKNASDKNCAIYPRQESGFYDGSRLAVQMIPPATANLPVSLKGAATISTDWYVATRSMPFKLSECANPNLAVVSLNKSNGSLVCDKYANWSPNLVNSISKTVVDDSNRRSIQSPMMGYMGGVYDRDYLTNFIINSVESGIWLDHNYAVDGDGENGGDLQGATSFSNSNKTIDFNTNSSLNAGFMGFLSINSNSSLSQFMFLAHKDSLYNLYIDFALACPADVDGLTDFDRYKSSSSIKPGYLSCYTLKQGGKDSVLYDAKVKNINDLDSDETDYAVYPVMTVYNGSDHFDLYSIKLTRQKLPNYAIAGLTNADIQITSLPCSPSYSKYCAANVK